MKLSTRSALAAWLEQITEGRRLIAPVLRSGVSVYRVITGVDEIDWEFSRPTNPIKEFLFPQTEPQMSIESHNGDIILKEVISHEETLIFGVRPCDMRGILALDAIFLDAEPVDRQYAARRENTVLIGLTCRAPIETCFCTSLGGAPDDPTGMDVMLTEIEDGYLVESVTEKGDVLINSLSMTDAKIPMPDPVRVPQYAIPAGDLLERVFDSVIWEEEGERCLSCRMCAYLCPTCRCFDIQDELVSSANGQRNSERIRCWDSCGGEAYRKIAGGHNPREIKADRLRNRVLCKLQYFASQYGPIACTGCGRCIEVCPVNIDITEILGWLAEEVMP